MYARTPPIRKKNADYRSREYLTAAEVEALIDAAGQRGRHRLRDRTLLLMMFRHGLRAGEVALLRRDAVMLDEETIYITRLKRGESGTHQLQSDELEGLRAIYERYPDSRFVFVGERTQRLSPGAIAKIVERAGAIAELNIKVHPHMLRHACGHWLANQGLDTRLIQDYLGHRNIQHTVRYTKLNAARFKAIQW